MRSTGRDLPRRGQSPQWSGTCREGAQRGREARLDHGRARLRTEIPQGRPCRKGDRGGQSGSSTWARVSGCSFCPGPNSSLPSLPSASTAVLFTGPLLQESPLSEDRPDFSAEPPASCFGRGVGGPWGVSLLRLRPTFSPLPSLWAERHLCWRQAPLCPRTQGYCKGKVKVRTAEGWGDQTGPSEQSRTRPRLPGGAVWSPLHTTPAPAQACAQGLLSTCLLKDGGEDSVDFGSGTHALSS